MLVLVLSDLWAEVPRKRKRRQPSILRYTLWHRSQSLASMAPLSLFIGGFISSMLSVIFIDRHQPPLAACICMNLISFLLLILHEYCHSIFKSARTTPLYARVSERLTQLPPLSTEIGVVGFSRYGHSKLSQLIHRQRELGSLSLR